MAILSRGHKKRLVVDIGTSAIRLAELGQTKSGYQLLRYMQRDFNSDPSLEEAERKQIRRDALQSLLKESKIRTRKTIFAVPGQSVFTRTRTLPPVPEYKVNQIVKYEIQQQIPFALDQIAMSYQVLNRTEAGGYEVMMAAIKVDVVDKHLELLEAAKRSVDTVDVAPVAAYNWLKQTGEFGTQGECVALIDIGASTTDIVIERDNQFRFTRPLAVGGNDVTQAIASAFNMSFVDAERLKREKGFAPTGDAQRDGKGGEVIGAALQRLVAEIMRSFAYFRSLPGGGPVNRVILCGGGASMRNMVPFMQQQIGVEVRKTQPVSGMAVAPGAQQISEHPEQACVVLGMALRCWQPVTIEANLIPPRILARARQREQVFYWTLSLATLALIMASIIPVSANENRVVQERIDVLTRAIGMYDPELPRQIQPGSRVPESSYKREFNQVRSAVQSLKQNVDVLDEARVNRRFWLPEMLILNETRPTEGGIWFSAIETTRFNSEPTGYTPAPAQMAAQTYDDDEWARGQGYIIGPTAGPGAAQDTGPTFESTGFPGLLGSEIRTPGRGRMGGGGMGMGMMGGGGGMNGRDFDDDRGGGGMGGRGMATTMGPFAEGQPAPKFPDPNGFILNGFATDAGLIREYIENLQRVERQLPNGYFTRVGQVEFDEATVQMWDRSILMNAPLDLEGTGAAMARAMPGNPNNVYSFVLHVKFVRSETRGGEPLPDPPMPEAPSAAGAWGGGLAGGFGGFGRDADDPLIR